MDLWVAGGCVVAMKWREKGLQEALLEREALSRGCGKSTQGKNHILFGGLRKSQIHWFFLT